MAYCRPRTGSFIKSFEGAENLAIYYLDLTAFSAPTSKYPQFISDFVVKQLIHSSGGAGLKGSKPILTYLSWSFQDADGKIFNQREGNAKIIELAMANGLLHPPKELSSELDKYFSQIMMLSTSFRLLSQSVNPSILYFLTVTF